MEGENFIIKCKHYIPMFQDKPIIPSCIALYCHELKLQGMNKPIYDYCDGLGIIKVGWTDYIIHNKKFKWLKNIIEKQPIDLE